MPTIAILMPVYHDTDSAVAVIAQLEAALQPYGGASIVAVDDGSNPRIRCADLERAGVSARLSVVTLRRNIGHQRAIAIGLAFIEIGRAYV